MAADPIVPRTRRALRAAVSVSAPKAATPITEHLTRRAARAAAAASASPLLPSPEPAVSIPVSEPVIVISASAPEGLFFEAPAPIPDAAEPFEASAPFVDLFEEAVRAFGTNEIPVASHAPSVIPRTASPAHLAPRRGFGRKLVTAGFTFSVMAVTSLLAISMTLPSEAVAAAQGTPPLGTLTWADPVSEGNLAFAPDDIQAFVAPDDIETEVLERASAEYGTMSLVKLAATQGIHFSDALYTNDPNASIQWPFLVGVAMSSSYGMRRGRMHLGIDLVPGAGAPIQAIADGVVRVSTEAGGGYGVHVWIDHVFDGVHVSSHYAHMQYGSLRVQVGDHVKVGDIIGKVGNTGQSHGAHLHFEITVNGTHVDPLPFMQKYAGTYY